MAAVHKFDCTLYLLVFITQLNMLIYIKTSSHLLNSFANCQLREKDMHDFF
jgi:hypothetical protein